MSCNGQDKHILAVKDVEADEIWGFVRFKNRHKLFKKITDPHVGDAYTFVGIERNTKLVLAWHLGERGMEDTEAFTEKLNAALGLFSRRLNSGWRAKQLDWGASDNVTFETHL